MSTIERANRASFRQRAQVVLDEIEYIVAEGDRLPKSSGRRPARVVGFDLVYDYNANIRRWNLNGFDSKQLVQQQRQDGSWSDGQWRSIPYGHQPPVAERFAPDVTPEVTW